MENKNTVLSWLNTKFVLGLAIIISTIIGSYSFYQIRALENTLTVTGSASKQVTSDHVKWVGVISHISTMATLKSGYANMASDLANVKTFLKSKNISDDQIVTSPVFMEQNYDQQQGAERTYTLRQTVDVNSSDVGGIAEVAKNIQPLIEKGVVFSPQSLAYPDTRLPDERVSMLADAIKDAKARAGKLAESSGKVVGQLKSASSGVVQVMSANSLDVSDYGSYDTSKVEKSIMITVKASFTLK
ncbi:MAG: SIMPL domain-containing protein [bacterium]